MDTHTHTDVRTELVSSTGTRLIQKHKTTALHRFLIIVRVKTLKKTCRNNLKFNVHHGDISDSELQMTNH